MDIPLHIDTGRAQPYYRQLYEQIRDGVESGRLPAGTRLPSSRELAARLRIGRHTVTDAYDHLLAEGYLESQVGSSTVVAAWTRDRGREQSAIDRPRIPYRLHRRLSAFPVAAPLAPTLAPARFDFRSPLTVVPMGEWQRILAHHWSDVARSSRSSRVPGGDPRLREQLARYLGASRGLRCAPDQIVITNSDQQALSLVAHLTVGTDDEVLVEDPGSPASRLAFQAYGASLVPVPVDADGLDVAATARAASPRTRLLYVTPSHQFPTGALLSLTRRRALLAWARSTETLIVEDDYDSSYRYSGATLGSLQGDDPDLVLYVGSLRQIVGNTVGVGYVVVPAALAEAAAALQWSIDKGAPPFLQAALAEFMASPSFARHVRRLRRQHQLRRDTLRDALLARFADDVIIGPATAGTFVHVRWRGRPSTPALVEAALGSGVGLFPLESCHLGPPREDPGVLMFYGGLSEAQIHEGVRRLAEALG